jgi:hypothetical protein
MLVALPTIVPRVFVIIAVVLVIVVALVITRTRDDAAGRECNESQ